MGKEDDDEGFLPAPADTPAADGDHGCVAGDPHLPHRRQGDVGRQGGIAHDGDAGTADASISDSRAAGCGGRGAGQR